MLAAVVRMSCPPSRWHQMRGDIQAELQPELAYWPGDGLPPGCNTH